MPTVTVRLDDETRDALHQSARDKGVTVSDFVRDLIREQMVDVQEDARSEGFAPETLSPRDRLMFSLLHRILGRVLPEGANGEDGDLEYQLERAQVLEEGFTEEYWVEFAGIRSELSKRDSQRVMDILEMFRSISSSLAQLQTDGTPVGQDLAQDLRYRGFDHNIPLEHKMATYVKFMISDDRYNEHAEFVNGPARGNSHSRKLDTYLRMLGEYRRILERRRQGPDPYNYFLSVEDLRAIAAEQIHPSRRDPGTRG